MLLLNLCAAREGRESVLVFFRAELSNGWIFLTLEKDIEGAGVAEEGIGGVSNEKLFLESTGAEGRGSKYDVL